MEDIDNKTEKIKILKITLMGVLSCFIIWLFAGVYITYLGLTERVFNSVSSPISLFDKSFFGIHMRITDHFSKFSNIIVLIILLIFTFAVSIISIYFIKRGRSVFSTIKFFLLNLITVLFFSIIFFLLVPASVERVTYWVISTIHSHRTESITKNTTFDSNIDSIFEKQSIKKYNIYADYNIGGGILLSTIIGKNKGRDLTYYESFYLPIFLSKHNIKAPLSLPDQIKVIMVNDESIVIGNNIDKDYLQKISLPIASSVLINSYPELIPPRINNLKDFKIVDDAGFDVFYKLKTKMDLEGRLFEINKSYVNNKNIIDNYKKNLRKNDLDYQELVVKQEKRYQDGCIKAIIYNDCDKFRETIDTNKIIIANNRKKIDYNYNTAIIYNKENDVYIDNVKKKIEEMESDKNNLENTRGEYSAGITFNGDSVYIRYFKDSPVSGDYFRIVTHELLHVYSNSGHGNLPVAFDESVTDYLSTKALGYSELDSIRSAGYPVELQVLYALLEKIPLKDVVDCYFAKDEDKLKSLMKKYFPDVDYANFIKEYNKLLEGTAHLNGSYHSFDKGLIDNPEVESMRLLLKLSPKKFYDVIY